MNHGIDGEDTGDRKKARLYYAFVVIANTDVQHEGGMSMTDRLQSIKTHDSSDPTDVFHVQHRSTEKFQEQQGHRVYIEQPVAENYRDKRV